ncbi:MAG: ATP-binding cassette domain-containing protein, partial [Dongiaceae bacterium]
MALAAPEPEIFWKPSIEELASRPIVIEVNRLDWSFGSRQVLFDINMRVHEGEIMVIMGGSGSGKSTLLRHMMGLELPTSGVVRVLGKDVAHLSRED